MRLQQLEIKGFKSFANETTINFNEDVIGIVGPNGSGKSNIVDAIRWVLGEQKSRELRLDQMSSVIFNGAKKRKAAGLAQVSLTFENTRNLLPTEYHSIKITRILYRSGESEYRLNGVPCRLKDITSLFLDTGIGSNSYAIIALGMVDDILADKDDARRRMFEQAAGVSKYKLRKKETLAKLKSATEDLDRVEDLLFEIDGNLKALEKQAKRTKKYFELKEQYKHASTVLARLKIADLKIRQKELADKLIREEDSYRQVEIDLTALEARLEADKKGNLDKEKTLSDRQRELNHLVGQLRGKENDKKMMEQRLQFIAQSRSKWLDDIKVASFRMGQLKEEIETYRGQLNEEKRLEAGLESELENAEKKLQGIRDSHSSIKADLDWVVGQQQQVEKAAFELEKQKAVNSNQIQSAQRELETLALDIDLRKKEIAGLQEKIQVLETSEAQKNASLSQLEQAETQRHQELSQTEKELEAINERLAKVNRELDAKKNEYRLTQSMIEKLEGFPESIRFLSSTNSKDWNKDTPLLSDLIYVKEDYRVAIENYLEPYLNYYVVGNLEDAYKAIHLLSQSQKGKANFFLLDAFQQYTPPLAMVPGALQAIDLIETEPAYRQLCAYLLENVFLTEHDDFHQQLPQDNLVLLSKSGSFIRRAYSLSGGSIGLFEGKKIGRKKNQELLEKAIAKLEKEQASLSTEFFTLKKRLEALRAQKNTPLIDEERRALNRLAQEKVSLVTRRENFEHFIQDTREKEERLKGQIQQLSEKNASIEEELGEKQRDVAQIKAQISQADGSFRQVAEQLSEASTAFNDKNIEFIRQQNKVVSLQRELAYREKQLEESQAARQNAEKQITQSETETLEVEQSMDALQQELQDGYVERQAKEAQLTEAEQVYFKARGGILEMEEQLRKLSKIRQDNQILINSLKEKANDLKFEVSSVAQRLRIEFNLEINEIINQPLQGEYNADEMAIQVDKYRSRLENYGEINPMAVEAYDEMKERYDTISQQRDDILKAKSDLETTIKEIEETATTQFLDAFERVRLYFIDVFRSLFTEDDACDLILLDPQDPLESGIEIVAKPKGKRPQTISQLSGGEKTLTATALLFALYLLKPAPFCIFDEVDAPLDDANIEKFNRIIKKFSKESQFIIVTHNKLTMAAVDVIYGVYMAEQGVSGVSSVDFRDFEHTAVFEVAGN
ncbi:MAG TPA: chromosome segregation protein SMC [Saprospiraceae bacterium]|nr:chromosome segregation protein SMC [Saprospiraceae bacterium]HMQ83290.1 chromosome segregation protein SMC [Saprospiraceae bacterium]